MALAKSILPDLEVGQSAFSAETMLLIWVEFHWNSSKITILKWMNEMRHRVYIHILLLMYKDGQRYRHDVHDLVALLLISKQRGIQWGPSRRMFAR